MNTVAKKRPLTRIAPDREAVIVEAVAASDAYGLYEAVILAFDCALKIGTILSLDWADINLNSGYIDLSYDGVFHLTPMSDRVKVMFKARAVRENGPVFRDIRANTLQQSLARKLTPLGINYTFEDFRCERICRYIETGVTLIALKRFVGTDSYATLKAYMGLYEEWQSYNWAKVHHE